MAFNLQAHIYKEEISDGLKYKQDISGVTLKVYNASGNTLLGTETTDANGIANFQSLTTPNDSKIYIVVASAMGYAIPDKVYAVVEDGTTEYVSLRLVPAPVFDSVEVIFRVAGQDESNNLTALSGIKCYLRPIRFPQTGTGTDNYKYWLTTREFAGETDDKGELILAIPKNLGACMIEIPDCGIQNSTAIVEYIGTSNIDVGVSIIGSQAIVKIS